MNFGPVTSDLLPGATNAVETCLGVRAGERVALIADEPSREVAASLAAALATRGARCSGCLIEELAPRPLARAPQALLGELEAADVGILCVQPLEGELTARMEIVATVARRQIRSAHMVGITTAIMRQGMRADYRLIDRLSDRLLTRMRTATSLTMKTDAGTAITATFD